MGAGDSGVIRPPAIEHVVDHRNADTWVPPGWEPVRRDEIPPPPVDVVEPPVDVASEHDANGRRATSARDDLLRALDAQVSELDHGRHRLQELADDGEAPDEVRRISDHVRDGAELVRCLRRLVKSLGVVEIYRALGAGGDWGYETPLGDALARLYREEVR